jgi:DNA-directed RNA polymerase specialized sigma subunit
MYKVNTINSHIINTEITQNVVASEVREDLMTRSFFVAQAMVKPMKARYYNIDITDLEGELVKQALGLVDDFLRVDKPDEEFEKFCGYWLKKRMAGLPMFRKLDFETDTFTTLVTKYEGFHGRDLTFEETFVEGSTTFDDSIESQIMITDFFATLPEQPRQILILKGEGFNDIEIAKILNISRQTVLRKKKECIKLAESFGLHELIK